jgi:hypothetical protein
MKKNILFICAAIAAFSLTAFGFITLDKEKTDPKEASCKTIIPLELDFMNALGGSLDIDLLYKVESRYMSTVTKEALNNAKSIVDILPEKATQSITEYFTSEVSILEGDWKTDRNATGNSEVLNNAQYQLLQTADYSTNIYIRSDYKNEYTGSNYLTYFMTVVPENQAKYIGGDDALIEYLKENSKKETAIIRQDQLKPGRVNFTVTKDGVLENVNLDSTSGYPTVDKVLVEMISNTQGKWHPASNSKGEKVDQTLVFFFGLQGC